MFEFFFYNLAIPRVLFFSGVNDVSLLPDWNNINSYASYSIFAGQVPIYLFDNSYDLFRVCVTYFFIEEE
jgi:hypothetical protein